MRDHSFGAQETTPAVWAYNRFLRGYFGAVPASILLAGAVYVAGWDDLTGTVGTWTVVCVFALLPAIIAFLALKTMPLGEEGAFLRSKIMPLLGEGVRGAVLVAMFVLAWGLGAFVTIGFAGMAWTAIRRLIAGH
jgi:hypothetical protein